MQDYVVASGIIVERGAVVFVQNRRKNGSLDWSTPGGVVDPGESVLEALAREVHEETALTVESWSPRLYSVDVDFVGRDLTLHAEVYGARSFRGRLHVDDPDEVVVDGRWVAPSEARALLDASPDWVAEPLRHALAMTFASPNHLAFDDFADLRWRYEVTGTSGGFRARLLEGPDG